MSMKSRGMKSNDRISMKSNGTESIDRINMKTCGLESNDRISMKTREMESSDIMSMISKLIYLFPHVCIYMPQQLALIMLILFLPNFKFL